MVINSPCLNSKKELAIPEQMDTGKESTNPLMADILPKTIVPTKLVKPQGFNLRPNMDKGILGFGLMLSSTSLERKVAVHFLTILDCRHLWLSSKVLTSQVSSLGNLDTCIAQGQP
ncbi:hypothetical protein Tco_1160434 [Tanacetum coccineum]